MPESPTKRAGWHEKCLMPGRGRPERQAAMSITSRLGDYTEPSAAAPEAGTGETSAHEKRIFSTALLWTQGVYYCVTGIWPLISVESFQWVTGRKTDHLVTGDEADHWLLMTVGVLVTAIGLALLLAAWRKSCPVEVAALALLSAIGLTAIDVVYVARGTIPPIYLADSVAEIALELGW